MKGKIAASLLVLALAAGQAGAQTDPFGGLYQGEGQPSSRTGSTSVSGSAGRSYAGASESGVVSMASLSLLPRQVAPMAFKLKGWNAKFLTGRPRIAVPTYTLAVVRAGRASAFGGGAGSEMAGRRASLTTALVGVSDEMAGRLAEEANKDLIQRLTAAGFDVVPQEQVRAHADMARLQSLGPNARGANGLSLYAPAAAPLVAGGPFASNPMGMAKASMVFNDLSAELDAVILNPALAVDYQQLESTGRRTFVGSAHVGARVLFSVLPQSGVHFLYGKRRGLGGGMGGNLVLQAAQGSDEQFGLMYEVDDRSDSVALHNAFAMAGLGSVYRQSKAYAVEVHPDRYAALVRAAYQGMNAAIVEEVRRARAAS
ncbi:MAG TPA: hypothetical protein VEA15_01590 [Caulobacteraceae bacterium]|nr:hypothetical protein [Caulobacteraceae bacterium]